MSMYIIVRKRGLVMGNYFESKKKIEKIRQEYSCKGDLIFQCAFDYLLECGQINLKDDEFVQSVFQAIDERHDKAENDRVVPFMTRDFEKAIVECAVDLSQFDARDTLMYVQRELWFFNGIVGELSYSQAIKTIQNYIEYMETEMSPLAVYEDLIAGGFEDEEIAELGFEHLLPPEEVL